MGTYVHMFMCICVCLKGIESLLFLTLGREEMMDILELSCLLGTIGRVGKSPVDPEECRFVALESLVSRSGDFSGNLVASLAVP